MVDDVEWDTDATRKRLRAAREERLHYVCIEFCCMNIATGSQHMHISVVEAYA